MKKTCGGVIADIEALRAIAVLIVIIGHLPWFWTAPPFAPLRAVLANAWIGVDMFFAISGFVITRSIIAHGGMRGHVLSFWTRRFFRIQPLAVTWLLIGILCTMFVNKHGFFGSLPANLKDTVAALFQVYNLYSLYLSEMYAQGTGIFGVYWSLSLEEQFYIALPFILLLPRRAMIAALIIGVVIQLPLPRSTLSVLWPLRFDALFLGALLAYAVESRILDRYEPKWLRWDGFPFMIATIAVLFILAANSKFNPTTGLIAIICAGLVYIASFDKGYIVGRGVSRTMLVYIGSRSFGLYLSHTICNRLATEICAGLNVPPHGMNLEYVAAALALTFVSTEFLYRYVEMPLRRYGRGVADRMDASYATVHDHLDGVVTNRPKATFSAMKSAALLPDTRVRSQKTGEPTAAYVEVRHNHERD